MSEQTEYLERKNKKKRKSLLLIDFNCLSNDEIMQSLPEIKIDLLFIFKKHIGKENAITPAVLFEEIFGMKAENIDIFKRNYWWNIIKGVCRELRKDEQCFIVNKGSYLFVLKSYDELKAFEKKVECDIRNLRSTKMKARAWVENESWRKLR